MLEATELFILALSVLIIILTKLIDKNPPPILGIYQRPNGLYWFKVAFIYLILSLRKLKPLKKEEEERKYVEIEKPQKFSYHDKAIDAVYMNGANKQGDFLVVGVARRKRLMVDGFLYLKIKSCNLGLLESPKLPSSTLYQENDIDEYVVEGIKLIPLEPMKKWRFSYEGKMKEFGNGTSTHSIKIDGIWSSELPYFNYDTDMDPLCMAKSMAYEKWSKTYFENIKANHQTHYEQFGTLKVTVTIDGKEYNSELDTVRDHSFGIHREWRQFKRYGLHFFTTENGDHFSLGKICLPISFSRLTIGYVYLAKEKKIFPIKECDLELYQHGEFGTPPKNYAFSINTGNKHFTVSVNVKDAPYFYISKDCEAKIFEQLCSFEVDGIDGWGAAEWQYRNIRGKECDEN